MECDRLHDSSKNLEVRRMMSSMNIHILRLLENRFKNMKYENVVRKFGKAWQWVNNSDVTPKGRIMVGWRPEFVNL